MYFIIALLCGILDIVVCTIVFPTQDFNCYNDQTCIHVVQIYSADGLDKNLALWIQMYGAISVSKLAVYISLLVNPYLIAVSGPALYSTGLDLKYQFTEMCKDPNYSNSTTCSIFENQFQTLFLLNEIEMISSVAVTGIIVIFGICGICILKGSSESGV